MFSRKYLVGLAVLVAVALLATVGIATAGEQTVSNTLTLTGSASEPPVIPTLTLEWVKVDGGSFAGNAATVTWWVGTVYEVHVKGTNTTAGAITGIYTKLTGWKTDEFELWFYLNLPEFPELPGNFEWYNLGADATGAQNFGWFDGTTYYFGPKGGDAWNHGQAKTVWFKITPLKAASINVSQVFVTGVTDPR